MLLSLAAPALTAAQPLAEPAEAPSTIDDRVEALLSRMTLAEKAGQMTQLTLQAFAAQEGTAQQPFILDEAALRKALVEDHVGSVLNVYNTALTPEEWETLITTVQDIATEETRLGIPIIYGIDAVHGHHYMMGATVFPHQLAVAATWNPELSRISGAITAAETRAVGIPWNFAPVLDVARQPLWSRFFETYGEDVHLASVMGRAYVEGQQGDDVSAPDRVAATAKHFLGYSMPLSGKDRTPAWIPERYLREYFLPPFVESFDAGIKTVMINSAEVNGVPVHASHEILTQLLRHELGFEGVAVTDWEDIRKLHELHRVADSHKEAVRQAVLAGIDMSMVPYDVTFTEQLIELVEEGAIPEARIDESVRRILKLKMELGLFEDAYPHAALMTAIGSEAHQQASRQTAEEALTLLKNDGVLPLAEGARVLVTGPGADDLPALHGSWSYTWQGTDVDAYPEGLPTALDALRDALGTDHVTYVPGAAIDEEIDVAAAAEAARDADVALIYLAEMPSVEKPGDIESLRLPEAQRRLAEAIQATGTPTVLVLLQNRPQIIRPIVDDAGAILMAYHPGPHGGAAIADVLTGTVNPSGKLPFTYPRHTGSLVPYDHKNSDRSDKDFGWDAINPQFPFGHGLSYTTFAYDNLTVSPEATDRDGTVTVSVDVTNTGDRAGMEVVQLYTRDLYASITPSMRRLRDFEKIDLAPGQTQTVTFTLPMEAVAFIGRTNEPIVEPGDFEVIVGDQTAAFRVR